MNTTFSLGTVVGTPGALKEIKNALQAPSDFLARHMRSDWGDVDEFDKAKNDSALRFCNGRLFSSYLTHLDVKIWVITEADRSSTTILLPSEY